MKNQRGSALLLLLLVLGVVGAYIALRTLGSGDAARAPTTAAALAQAKEALLGFAATYAQDHAGDFNGYLPLPDLGTSRNGALAQQEGLASGNFAGNGLNRSVLGRLPWRSLRLGPLRDGDGECLWYAVSGGHQDGVKTTALNWDTPGEFEPFSSDGTAAGTLSTVAAQVHQRPVALIFAPGTALTHQVRARAADDAVAECQGNYDARNYLDSFDPLVQLNGLVNTMDGLNHASGNYDFAAPKQFVVGPVRDPVDGAHLVNDRVLGITSDELFAGIKKRSDFKADIDALIGDLANHLNALAPANLPATSALSNKGVDLAIADFELAHPNWPARKKEVQTHWRNNLLYTRPAVAASVNGVAGCNAVLLFAGERTQRTLAPAGPQLRSTPAQTGSAALFGDPAMYLEGPNTVFPGSGAYAGTGFFNARAASADLVRCIKGLPVGAVQASFASALSGFATVGVGITSDAQSQSITLAGATGTTGGCLWWPQRVALAGRTLRVYYDFKFSHADAHALTGDGADRGNGFTLSFVRGDVAAAAIDPPSFLAPDHCGTESTMGALDSQDPWGSASIVLETDVHQDATPVRDPASNHTAIVLDGHLDHAQAGDSLNSACDGSAAGCVHTPANAFEESPLATHHQRSEIHSGCNADCSACNPAAHVAPTNYLRVSTWVDCADCADVALDLERHAQAPTLQRCLGPNAALDSAFFGLTGGFRSGTRLQSVTLSGFILRSE